MTAIDATASYNSSTDTWMVTPCNEEYYGIYGFGPTIDAATNALYSALPLGEDYQITLRSPE